MASPAGRLEALGIAVMPLPGRQRHFIYGRNRFAALVERLAEGGCRIGATGMIADQGLAMLVWREETAWFVAKSHRQPATSDEIEGLRQFAADLDSVLRLTADC